MFKVNSDKILSGKLSIYCLILRLLLILSVLETLCLFLGNVK